MPTINPDDFTDSQWSELYYAGEDNRKPKSQRLIECESRASSEPIEVPKEAVEIRLGEVRSKIQAIRDGVYGRVPDPAEDVRWLADLAAVAEILEGYLR